MIYGSVCSGIEAASVAWEPLGWRCAFVSEIEKFPRAVLEHRLGAGSPNGPALHGDFTTIEEDTYEPIDLLVGGTPCQSFSVAGKRLGLDDPRGNLALEYVALARRLRPRWLVWENVPGVLSSDGGRDFGTFLAACAGHADGRYLEPRGGRWETFGICEPAPDSAGGYGLAWRVLDAQYVRVDGYPHAVPQRRRRVFVVGYLGDWRRAAAVLFERESLSGHPAPRRETGERIADSLTVGAKQCSGFPGDITHDVAPSLVSSGRGVGRVGETRGQDPVVADVAPTLNAHFGDKMGLENQHIDQGGVCSSPPVAMSLNAHGGRIDAETETLLSTTGGGFDVSHTLKAEGFDASEDGTGRGTPILPVAFNGRQDPDVSGDVTGPLDRDGQTQCIAFSSKDHGADASDEVAPTLRAGGHDGSHANAGVRDDGAAYTLEARQVPQAVAFSIMPMNSGKDYKARETEVAQPIMAGGPVGGNQGGDYIANTYAVRRLTPTECERLQGFEDDFTRIPWRGKPAEECPDGQRYKALGNSFAVNVVRWIGRRIQIVEEVSA